MGLCDRGGHASSGRTSSGCPAAPPASAPGRVRLSAAAGRTAVRGRRGRGAAPSAPAQHPPTWRCPRARASRPPRRLGLHRCPCQEMPAAGRRPAPGTLRHSPQTGALLAPSRPPPRGDRSPSARRGRGGPARCLPPRLSARCRPAARAVREADAAPGEEHPQRRRGGTPSRAPVPRPRAAETGSRAGGLGMGRGGTAGTRGLPCALLLRVAFLLASFYLGPGSPRAAGTGAETEPRGEQFESRHLPAPLREEVESRGASLRSRAGAQAAASPAKTGGKARGGVPEARPRVADVLRASCASPPLAGCSVSCRAGGAGGQSASAALCCWAAGTVPECRRAVLAVTGTRVPESALELPGVRMSAFPGPGWA